MDDHQFPHTFQKPLPLENAVNKLRQAEKLKRLRDYNAPPIKVKVEQQDDNTYKFQMTFAAQFKLYDSRFLEVQVNGYLHKINENETRISYNTKLQWGYVLFWYGMPLTIWSIGAIARLPMLIIGIVAITVNVVWEVVKAREIMREIPFLMDVIFAP